MFGDTVSARIFVVTLVVQQPHNIFGFVADLCPYAWPAVQSAAADDQRLELVGRPFYNIRDGGHVSICELGLDAEDELVVYEGVRHVHEGVVLMSMPEPLEKFECLWRRPAARQGRQRSDTKKKTVMPADVLAKMMEEFLWLSENDVTQAIRCKSQCMSRPKV